LREKWWSKRSRMAGCFPITRRCRASSGRCSARLPFRATRLSRAGGWLASKAGRRQAGSPNRTTHALSSDGATLGERRAHMGLARGRRRGERDSRRRATTPHPNKARTFRSPACAAHPFSAHWVATPSHTPGALPNAQAPVAAPQPGAARLGAADDDAGSVADANPNDRTRAAAVARRKVRRMSGCGVCGVGCTSDEEKRVWKTHPVRFIFPSTPRPCAMLLARRLPARPCAALLSSHTARIFHHHVRCPLRQKPRPSSPQARAFAPCLNPTRRCRRLAAVAVPAAASGSDAGGAGPPSPPTVILYTKAGCSLCEGLEVSEWG